MEVDRQGRGLGADRHHARGLPQEEPRGGAAAHEDVPGGRALHQVEPRRGRSHRRRQREAACGHPQGGGDLRPSRVRHPARVGRRARGHLGHVQGRGGLGLPAQAAGRGRDLQALSMKRDEIIGSETVEALSARTPFRFPREMVVGLLLLAVAWQILSFFVPPFIVPGWERILKTLVTLPLGFVAITLARVIGALVVSFVLGLGLAVAMYLSTPVERYGRPIVRLFMAVPVVCWILFAVLWFKWVEFRIAFVLVVVCAPVFLVDFLDAMKGVSKDLRDMLRSFRPTGAQFFTKLVLPATLPIILTSWKINLSLAIRVVTIAELVGAVTGIGYGLVVAQELFSVSEVFAWTLILVVILFVAEAVLTRIEERMLRWRV